MKKSTGRRLGIGVAALATGLVTGVATIYPLAIDVVARVTFSLLDSLLTIDADPAADKTPQDVRRD